MYQNYHKHSYFSNVIIPDSVVSLEDYAKRALVYPNRILAEEFCKGKDVLIYEDHTVTGKSIIVFPPYRMMFAKANDLMITHGGIHIEEVIVPFVEVLK